MMLPSSLVNKTEWTFVGPMGPDLSDVLRSYPVIAVDGGGNFVQSPDIWVGDADSLSVSVDSPHIYRHPPEKDKSDLALALSLFSGRFRYKFHFWGFIGGRRDHELFNLGEALKFLDEHSEGQILFYDEHARIIFHLLGAGHWRFNHKGLFSLGTIKKTTVKLKGECDYPIEKPHLLTPLSSFGLSNVGRGDMILENEGSVFIYYPEGK